MSKIWKKSISNPNKAIYWFTLTGSVSSRKTGSLFQIFLTFSECQNFESQIINIWLLILCDFCINYGLYRLKTICFDFLKNLEIIHNFGTIFCLNWPVYIFFVLYYIIFHLANTGPNTTFRQLLASNISTSRYISMTSLLTHTVAHSTKPSFRPKTNNQPLKKFLSLAVSWVKVVKNCKILTFKVNFLCQNYPNLAKNIFHWRISF